MDLKDTISSLSNLPAPSGLETRVASAVKELLSTYMDEVTIDKLGSVIGVRRCGRENAQRILLDAHLDEIGLIITGIEDGFLRFAPVGGIDPRMLPSKEITILSDPPVYGVVACMPPHLLTQDEKDSGVPIEEMVIDIGMTSEEAEKAVKIGTFAVFDNDCIALGDNMLCGKALDDRACFAVLLRALDMLKNKDLNVDLFVMGSVQEEVGLRGASAGAFSVNPDYCIAVDVTHGSTPDAQKDKTYEMGGGAVIGIGPNITRSMSEKLIELAKAKDIKYQLEVMERNSGTNAWLMQISREGIATAVVSLPLKYMHSPIETLDLTDAESVALLIFEYIIHISEKEAAHQCWSL